MVPVLVLLILNVTPANYPLLIFLFIFSALLDFFDGFLARKLGQETEYGKILDPLADKLLVVAIILALIVKSNFPIWLGAIIISRDLIILIASLIVIKDKRTIIPSVLVGKITFGILSFMIMVFILDLHEGMDLEVLKRYASVMCSSFIIWSMIEYYKIYKGEMNGKKEVNLSN
jgi:CDP-diacylglycerol--glycerol-3-phosphate 3-phosphatidyltransferase